MKTSLLIGPVLCSVNILSAQTVNFQTAQYYQVSSNPLSIAVADFNGDSYTDIATVLGQTGNSNQVNNQVSVLLNKENGTFNAEQLFDTGGTQTLGISAGDFNKDGKPDIVVANEKTVAVLMNSGTGTFLAAQIYPQDKSPYSVGVGDFNGDGALDIAAGSWEWGTVTILQNSGNGVFTNGAVYTISGSDLIDLAVADVNKDGKLDIITANNNLDTISVLLNNNNGTFHAPVSYTVDTDPTAVAVGDFNGDGAPDLATASETGNAVSILMNNGNGTFKAKVSYAVNGSLSAVAVADFNNDGKPDIIVAGRLGQNLSLLLNNGDGTFAPQQTYSINGIPSGIVATDFNNDRKADIAVASPQVAILLQANNLSTTESNISTPLYPNPTSGIVHITSPAKSDAGVYDLSGKLIMNQSMRPGDNQINLTGLIPGVYVIKIATQTFKVVKK